MKISTKVKQAWRKERRMVKAKDADGNVSSELAPGVSLKVWARTQIKNKTDFSQDCKQWFNNK